MQIHSDAYQSDKKSLINKGIIMWEGWFLCSRRISLNTFFCQETSVKTSASEHSLKLNVSSHSALNTFVNVAALWVSVNALSHLEELTVCQWFGTSASCCQSRSVHDWHYLRNPTVKVIFVCSHHWGTNRWIYRTVLLVWDGY